MFGFRKNHIFFDTFIGIFFWLGFWLKLSVRLAFLDGRFIEKVGNFDYSGDSYDQVLIVISCGILALILASLVRQRFFSYSCTKKPENFNAIFWFYKRFRKIVLLLFVLAVLAVAVSNVYFGIYQRGTVPRTVLPLGFGGVFTWLLLFGFTSFSAVILDSEFKINSNPYFVMVVCFAEGFFSNVSMLSRGMIINMSALVLGTVKKVHTNEIKIKLRFVVASAIIFAFLFGLSVFAANCIRTSLFSSDRNVDMHAVRDYTVMLVIDRWVGIEGAMAVTSYPQLGWTLFKSAWQEKYYNHGTSMYDSTMLKDTMYVGGHMTRHHFVSLPGILAFFYYPGSKLFLFVAMFVAGLLAGAIELAAYKFGGEIITCHH